MITIITFKLKDNLQELLAKKSILELMREKSNIIEH